MKTDAIIFDIDGTLTDSTNAVTVSWNRYLAGQEYPYRPLTPELTSSLMGKTMDDWALAVLPEVPLEISRKITICMEEAENEEIRTNGTNLYPGVRDTFALLSKDYDLYILSNCGQGYIEAVMAHAQIEEFVKGHLCFGDNNLDKQDNLKLMMKQYDMKHPVYVGDTQKDRECCEIAGLPFIFVSWGFGDVPDAQYRADSMQELPDVIRSVR